MKYYSFNEEWQLIHTDEGGCNQVVGEIVWDQTETLLASRQVKWWKGVDNIISGVTTEKEIFFSRQTNEDGLKSKASTSSALKRHHKVVWTTTMNTPTIYAPGKYVPRTKKKEATKQSKKLLSLKTMGKKYNFEEDSDEHESESEITLDCHILASTYGSDSTRIDIPSNYLLVQVHFWDIDVEEYVSKMLKFRTVQEFTYEHVIPKKQKGWSAVLMVDLSEEGIRTVDSSSDDFVLPVDYYLAFEGQHLYRTKYAARRATLMKLLVFYKPEALCKLIPLRDTVPGIILRERMEGLQKPRLLIKKDGDKIIGFDFIRLFDLNAKHKGCFPSNKELPDGIMSTICRYKEYKSLETEHKKRNRGRKNTKKKNNKWKRQKRQREKQRRIGN